jgi:membrane dipeptidase
MMTERRRALDEQISIHHAHAREFLGATDAQVQAGFELHRELLVCDSFGFLPSVLSSWGVEQINRAVEEHWDASEVAQLHLDMRVTGPLHDDEAFALNERIFEVAGVNATFTNAGCGPNIDYTTRCAVRYQQACDGLREVWTKAFHADDAREAFAQGKRAMFWSANNPPSDAGFMDGYNQLYWLGAFHRLGFRMMHLTYNRRNWVGDGCMEPVQGGLSAFGHEVVAAMNDLGIIIDTPHTGGQTTLDAARVSRAPIAASHTVCRALRDHPRGKTDEQMRAIADGGGYIGITCVSHFLSERGGTIVDLLDHVDYAVNVVGIDHVGIGTDTGFTAPPPAEPEMLPLPRGRGAWWSYWPEGTSSAGMDIDPAAVSSINWICWPYFTTGLLMRGYSEGDIAKIVGGNILRTLAEVEAQAITPVR